MFAGLALLALANGLRALNVHLHSGIPENLLDGGMGLCYGLSFGLMILGFKRRSSGSSCGTGSDRQ